MNSSALFPRPYVLMALAVSAASLLLVACDPKPDVAEPGHDSKVAPADATLDESRVALIDLAFRTASLLPLNPHVKDRARAQEKVVAACLKLDQPARAASYIPQIPGWRRGSAYADLAFYYAERGHPQRVPHYLRLALEVAEAENGPTAQEWRRDAIRIKVARTHALLGNTRESALYETGVVPAESGKVDVIRARTLPPENYESTVDALDAVVANGSFDQVKHALQTCAELFDRFHDDEDRRAAMAERVRTGYAKLPVLVRARLMMRLVSAALDHGDTKHALELISETTAMLEQRRWRLRDRMPLSAELAVLHHRAGEVGQARADVDKLLETFEKRRLEIVNIYRADVLLPIAEAFDALGDGAQALAVYKQAVEEGVVNPNSRPRADDLVATCCSLALTGVVPDKALKTRLDEVHEALGNPW